MSFGWLIQSMQTTEPCHLAPSSIVFTIIIVSLQDPGRSVPFEEGSRTQFLTPLIKEKGTKQNKIKNPCGTLRFFFLNHFSFFYLGFTLFLQPLGSLPGLYPWLTLSSQSKWSVSPGPREGAEAARLGWTWLSPLTLYTLMWCEVASLNSLSSFFDVPELTDGIHFHAVRKT